MRIGVLLPHRDAVMKLPRRPPVEECWTVARMADEAGMHVWAGDSIGAKSRLDALTTLAYVAAMTQRVRLGTAILLPAMHQPTLLANALVNIDQISQGRLVLGLGVVWSQPEIELEWAACGAEYQTRVRDLEEYVVVWRKLWSGTPVTHLGNGYTLSGHTIAPLPWSESGPPVLITAGNRGQLISAQIERFARLGDGIVTTYVTDDDCRVLQQLGDEALERHRRPPGAFPICAYTTVRISASVGRALAVTDEFLEKYYKRPSGTCR